jgi:hypothetical protein
MTMWLLKLRFTLLRESLYLTSYVTLGCFMWLAISFEVADAAKVAAQFIGGAALALGIFISWKDSDLRWAASCFYFALAIISCSLTNNYAAVYLAAASGFSALALGYWAFFGQGLPPRPISEDMKTDLLLLLNRDEEFYEKCFKKFPQAYYADGSKVPRANMWCCGHTAIVEYLAYRAGDPDSMSSSYAHNPVWIASGIDEDFLIKLRSWQCYTPEHNANSIEYAEKCEKYIAKRNKGAKRAKNILDRLRQARPKKNDEAPYPESWKAVPQDLPICINRAYVSDDNKNWTWYEIYVSEEFKNVFETLEPHEAKWSFLRAAKQLILDHYEDDSQISIKVPTKLAEKLFGRVLEGLTAEYVAAQRNY